MGIMGGETDCMIGFHAISVLGEAIVKDLGGFDYEKAYQLCKKTYEAGRDQFPSYEKYGYVPSNETGRKSVSKTVEYAYNDWCLAQIAKRLGHQEDYEFYLKRSENYRNLFDGETGFSGDVPIQEYSIRIFREIIWIIISPKRLPGNTAIMFRMISKACPICSAVVIPWPNRWMPFSKPIRLFWENACRM